MSAIDDARVAPFDEIASRLAGNPLYVWQGRLLRDFFAKGSVPPSIDVPTGLGKTKVIALWLAALACGANLPRRLVYVVDRRAVVDQATVETESIVTNLALFLGDSSFDGVERDNVRQRLRTIGDRIPISTLRGQFVDNREWFARPHGAAIVVGTVDMIGSRLLFSGYGVSPRLRPMQAALLGCDALFAVDEAHLVPPFEALLRGVVAERGRNRAPADDRAPRSIVMSLSATNTTRDASTSFALEAGDLVDERVGRRFRATKRLSVGEPVAPNALADRLAERAWALAEGSRRIVVFCNSRKDAQKVALTIAARLRKASLSEDLCELLVGERRLRERMAAYDAGHGHAGRVIDRFRPQGDRHVEDPAFLIATSAGEVGVDLDADHLVCDLVAWERMVQRFGRVNRRDQPMHSLIEVIPCANENEDEDPVVAQRFDELLAPFTSPDWPVGPDGARDASPSGIGEVRRAIPDVIARAQTPRPLHPTLSAPLIDAWSMTWLRDHPGRPSVEPWIRGWVESPPQTRIVWRRYLPLRAQHPDADDFKELERYIEAAAPHATEVLEAPSYRVAEWLKQRFRAAKAASFDDTSSASDRLLHHPIVAVAFDDRLDVIDTYGAREVEPMPNDRLTRLVSNRTIVVDARLGGLDAKGLLDPNCDEVPPTIDGTGDRWGLDLSVFGGLRFRIEPASRLANDSKTRWRPADYRWTNEPDIDDPLTLWIELWRADDPKAGDPAVANRLQVLDEHLAWTREAGEEIARALALSDERTAMLLAAAHSHDLGKNRALWQDAMRAPNDGRPYAKILRGTLTAMLGGYRHEFGSLRDVRTSPAFRALAANEQDLALHLIAAHHGRARPTIAANDPDVVPTGSITLANDVTQRFVRLQRRIGPWDLAWWEALLKSADVTASRRANESDA